MNIRDLCEGFLYSDVLEFPETDFFEHLVSNVFVFIDTGNDSDMVVKSVIASAFSVANDCDFYIRGYDVKAVLINYERKQDCVYKNPERLNTTSYLRNALKATPLIQDVFECIKEAVLHFKALCKMRGVSYTDNYIIKSVLGSAFELTSEFVFYEFNGFIFARYVG